MKAIPQQSGRRTVLAIVLVLLILISLAWLAYNLLPHSPKVNPAPHVGLGQVLASETAKLVQDHGQIAVILPEYYKNDGAAVREQWQAFSAELKKHPGVCLAGIEVLDLTTLMESGVTRIQAEDILEKFPRINVLVSFCGVPPWNHTDLSALPHPAPKIVAVENVGVPIKAYLANGIAAVIIAPRIPPRTTARQPRSPAEWFDRSFQVYTSENYQSLPELTE